LAGTVVLALIFTLFYRYGVRIPLRPFFAVTSVLLYYMAFVFMGKGIRELQEVNAFPMTVLRGFPHIDAMGIYPTVETMLGQLLLVVLFVGALAKTFWPRRSVTLPTIPATPASGAASSGSAVAAATNGEAAQRAPGIEVERVVPIAALEESVQRLEDRVAGLERLVQRDAANSGDTLRSEEESLSGS
jgi:hypothetical protein